MTFESDVVKEVTDDFVGAFVKDEDYEGPVARLVGMGCLPDGVDPSDPRVVKIVERCKEK